MSLLQDNPLPQILEIHTSQETNHHQPPPPATTTTIPTLSLNQPSAAVRTSETTSSSSQSTTPITTPHNKNPTLPNNHHPLGSGGSSSGRHMTQELLDSIQAVKDRLRNRVPVQLTIVKVEVCALPRVHRFVHSLPATLRIRDVPFTIIIQEITVLDVKLPTLLSILSTATGVVAGAAGGGGGGVRKSVPLRLHLGCGHHACSTSDLYTYGKFAHWLDMVWKVPIIQSNVALRVSLWSKKTALGEGRLTVTDLLGMPTTKTGHTEIFTILRNEREEITGKVRLACHYEAGVSNAAVTTSNTTSNTTGVFGEGSVMSSKKGGGGNGSGRPSSSPSSPAHGSSRPRSSSSPSNQMMMMNGSHHSNNTMNPFAIDGFHGMPPWNNVPWNGVPHQGGDGGGSYNNQLTAASVKKMMKMIDNDPPLPLDFPLLVHVKSIALVDLLTSSSSSSTTNAAATTSSSSSSSSLLQTIGIPSSFLFSSSPVIAIQLGCDRKEARTEYRLLQGGAVRFTNINWTLFVRKDSILTLSVGNKKFKTILAHAEIATELLVNQPVPVSVMKEGQEEEEQGGEVQVTVLLKKDGTTAGRAILTLQMKSVEGLNLGAEVAGAGGGGGVDMTRPRSPVAGGGGGVGSNPPSSPYATQYGEAGGGGSSPVLSSTKRRPSHSATTRSSSASPSRRQTATPSSPSPSPSRRTSLATDYLASNNPRQDTHYLVHTGAQLPLMPWSSQSVASLGGEGGLLAVRSILSGNGYGYGYGGEQQGVAESSMLFDPKLLLQPPPAAATTTSSSYPIGQLHQSSGHNAAYHLYDFQVTVDEVDLWDLLPHHGMLKNSPSISIACGKWARHSSIKEQAGNACYWTGLQWHYHWIDQRAKLRFTLHARGDRIQGTVAFTLQQLVQSESDNTGFRRIQGNILDMKKKIVGKIKVSFVLDVKAKHPNQGGGRGGGGGGVVGEGSISYSRRSSAGTISRLDQSSWYVPDVGGGGGGSRSIEEDSMMDPFFEDSLATNGLPNVTFPCTFTLMEMVTTELLSVHSMGRNVPFIKVECGHFYHSTERISDGGETCIFRHLNWAFPVDNLSFVVFTIISKDVEIGIAELDINFFATIPPVNKNLREIMLLIKKKGVTTGKLVIRGGFSPLEEEYHDHHYLDTQQQQPQGVQGGLTLPPILPPAFQGAGGGGEVVPLLGHHSPSAAPSRRPSSVASNTHHPPQETLFSRFKRRQSASSDAYDRSSGSVGGAGGGGGGYRRGSSFRGQQEDEHGSLNGRSQSTGRLFQLPQFFSWHPHEGGGGGGGGGSSMAMMTMTGGSMTAGEAQGSPGGGGGGGGSVGGMGDRGREDDMSWAGSASAASSTTAKRRQEKKALSATTNHTTPLPGSGSPAQVIIASSSRSNNNSVGGNGGSGGGRRGSGSGSGGGSSPILRRGSSGSVNAMGTTTPAGAVGPPSSSSPSHSQSHSPSASYYHPTAQSITQQSLGIQSHQSLFQADVFPQGLMMEIYAIYAMELPSIHRLALNSPICAVACGRFTSSTDERKGSGSKATWEDLSMRFLFEKKSNLRLLFLSKDSTIGFVTFHREMLLNGKSSQAGKMMVLGDILDSKNRNAGKVKVIYSIEIP
eukprot:gene6535-7208_t